MATVLLESEAPVVAYREPSSLQWRYQNLLASNAPASMEIDDTGLNGANYPPIPMQMPVPMAMAMPMQMPLPAPMPVMYALQAPMPPHIMYGNTVFPCFPVRY